MIVKIFFIIKILLMKTINSFRRKSQSLILKIDSFLADNETIKSKRSSVSIRSHEILTDLILKSQDRPKKKHKTILKKQTPMTPKHHKIVSLSSQFESDLKRITFNTSETLKELKSAKKQFENEYLTISAHKPTPIQIPNSIPQTLSEKSFFKTTRSKKSSRYRQNRFALNQKELMKKYNSLYSTQINYLSSFRMRKKTSEDFKQRFIQDRLNIMIENIFYFREKFKGEKLLTIFSNMPKETQIDYNKSIELLCALCIEISKIILGDFYDNVEQFILCKIPYLEDYENSSYKDEFDIFQINIGLLNDISVYIQACNDVFAILVKKVYNMKISNKKFHDIDVYLTIGREYSSNLSVQAKNYVEKIEQDGKLLRKFEEESNIKPKTEKKKMGILEKIQYKQVPTETEEIQKVKRIKNALNYHKKVYSDDFNRKKEKVKRKNLLKFQSLLHCSTLSKLLKYSSKEARTKIIAQRVIDRLRLKK